MRIQWMAIGCILGVFLAGCKQEDPLAETGHAVEPELMAGMSAAEVEATASYDTLMQEVEALIESGQRDEAAARLSAALDDPDLAMFGESLFRSLLYALLSADRAEDARLAVLASVDDQPEHASAGFMIVLNAIRSADPVDHAEALAWCDAVLDRAGDAELQTRVWQSKNEILLASGDRDALTAGAPAVLELGDAAAAVIAQRMFRLAKDEDSRNLVMAYAEALDADAGQYPQLVRTLTGAMIDAHLRDGALSSAETLIVEREALLDDGRLAGYVTRLMRAFAAEDTAGVDRLIAFAFDLGDERPRTRDHAGSAWVRLAAQNGDAQAFMERVEALHAAGASVRSTASAFASGFYLVMQSGDDALQARVNAMNQTLLNADGLDDSLRQMLLIQKLDAAFYSEAFPEALEILKAGIPNQDEAWHANLIGKVSAHIALQEDRFEDAIAEFRRHIESVKQWTDPMQNPETGLFVIKEVVLGFNEKRIGDIYAGLAGRDTDAAEAYERARKWYRKALEILEPGSPEYAEAQQELAAIDTK